MAQGQESVHDLTSGATTTTVGISSGDGYITREGTGMNTEVNEENISFDFFVNVPIDQVTDENMTSAMCSAVECEPNQLNDLKIEDTTQGNKPRVRISGKVKADSWEMTQLAGKFDRLITDRILSGALQKSLSLEDRPRVTRFYTRSSTQHIPSITTVSAYPHDNQGQPTTSTGKGNLNSQMKRTASARTAMAPDAPSIITKPVSAAVDENKPIDDNADADGNVSGDDDSPTPPSQAGKCCIIL